jgi:bifunctional UDP-N-acetylglucosamine pyrophosphorylase/glucosamine-1-phosphate N-acetyltransferase
MGDKDALLGLVLAAGRGTRMRSATPKLLHPVCGRPILRHAVGVVREAGAARIAVILGPEGEERTALDGLQVELLQQSEPLGTGHAVLQARTLLESHEGPVLVVNGDHPLYRPSTLSRLVERFLQTGADLVLLTGELDDPTGYGRIVRRPDGSIDRIVEESDAEESVRALREMNPGMYVARGPFFLRTLEQVKNENRQREYFLTDVVEVALRTGHRVETARFEDPTEVLGINTRADLARAESIMRRRIADQWMARGVSFTDPDHTYVDADVEIGMDTHLDPGSTLRRGTRVGERCRIYAGSVIDGTTLGDGVTIKPHCWLEDAIVGSNCIIGPSAHIRPGTVIDENVRIGNFVEVKNSRIGRGTKADHLSYIGDTDVGSGVTIGCGAITVNYDGDAKHRTRIGDGAFIGCNANLVAPVEIASGGYVAAGSTITKDVPKDSLGIARGRQRNVSRWRSRRFSGSGERED